ncbi:hypothetical protein Agub_g5600 [Astrephomene gubernaculifera]|uniref:Uncharacterized protein n=1 Tax=Astrephomene gubernaculifera TaxID=47775 RepID=A0AAD3DM50_9CHLO|nr:hypothetical protein Agub_g5600 [Astrephomene gubernaculifera]
MSKPRLSVASAVVLRNVTCHAGPISNWVLRSGRSFVADWKGLAANLVDGDIEEACNAVVAKRPRLGRSHDVASGSRRSTGLGQEENTVNVVGQQSSTLAYGWRPGEVWNKEQLELLVQYVASLPPGQPSHGREGVARLGWAELPDPDGAIRRRVQHKLARVRNQVANGADPFAGRVMTIVAARGTYNWRDWSRRALLLMPNHEGTLDDLAAFLQSDPDITPLLDHRPHPMYRAVPRWKLNLTRAIARYPEIINTGQKRGRLVVYRYDDEVARQLPGGRGPKAPKKGQKGVTHMGKKNKSGTIGQRPWAIVTPTHVWAEHAGSSMCGREQHHWGGVGVGWGTAVDTVWQGMRPGGAAGVH